MNDKIHKKVENFLLDVDLGTLTFGDLLNYVSVAKEVDCGTFAEALYNTMTRAPICCASAVSEEKKTENISEVH